MFSATRQLVSTAGDPRKSRTGAGSLDSSLLCQSLQAGTGFAQAIDEAPPWPTTLCTAVHLIDASLMFVQAYRTTQRESLCLSVNSPLVRQLRAVLQRLGRPLQSYAAKA